MSPAIVKPMLNSISREYMPILEHVDIGTRLRHIVFKAQGVIIDTDDVKHEARNDSPEDDAGYIHRVFS
jgi:heat shock protein HspQ